MTNVAGAGKGVGGNSLSPFDMGAISSAFDTSAAALHSRYQQLGLGVPDHSVFGGDPLTAATHGGSLAYGGPGTAEQTDITGLSDLATAASGQLQVANQNNPAIAGTPANAAQGLQSLGKVAQAGTFAAGAGLG